jgi:hypothetical protein
MQSRSGIIDSTRSYFVVEAEMRTGVRDEAEFSEGFNEADLSGSGEQSKIRRSLIRIQKNGAGAESRVG